MPFSLYSSNDQDTVTATGYSMRVQGHYGSGKVVVSHAGFATWTSCYLNVFGIK
jgi:hypothetical protein